MYGICHLTDIMMAAQRGHTRGKQNSTSHKNRACFRGAGWNKKPEEKACITSVIYMYTFISSILTSNALV